MPSISMANVYYCCDPDRDQTDLVDVCLVQFMTDVATLIKKIFQTQR